MALEAIVFSQDPITSYTACCNKDYNLYSSSSSICGNNLGMNYHDLANYSPIWNNVETTFDVNNYRITSSNVFPNSEILIDNLSHQWDQQHYHQQLQHHHKQHHFSSEQIPLAVAAMVDAEGSETARRKRRRRRRSNKNKEEVEQQRMTHIAVERNRRKQMNEYLAVIRSLMPPSYVQRGDQASIVGGAINYVKQLEQMLQSIEADKRNKVPHNLISKHNNNEHNEPNLSKNDGDTANDVDTDNKLAASSEESGVAAAKPVFAEFFSFPQYSIRSNQQYLRGDQSVKSNTSAGEIEVTMVDSHANVKILAKKQPKQLPKLVASFQGLRLSVLHLNVTPVDSFVLYSFSLKVEEGCQLNSVDEIAAAGNHVLRQIQEEAAVSAVL